MAKSFTHKVADVESLGYPVGGDTTGKGGQTVDVQSGGTAVDVLVASETGSVLWVADEEDTLDGGKGSTGESL